MTPGLVALALAAAQASAAPATPVVPQAEEVDVAVLPPSTPHRVYLSDSWTTGNTQVIDGDTAHLIGFVHHPVYSNFALDPAGRWLLVAESIWSKGNRGTRQDLLTLYDARSLSLVAEVPLPGRIITGDKPQMLGVSADGRFAYVFDMAPATSVHVVDLARRRMVSTAEVAGCGLVFPYGAASFASLCAEGAVARVTIARDGKSSQTRTAPLFDPENDPIIDQADLDASGHGWFVAYSGQVYPARLDAAAPLGTAFSLQEAAGQTRAGMKPGDLAWRPGGRQVSAWHAASNRLYVLMHAGEIWTHNEPGTELWVVDPVEQRVERRIRLERPAANVAVSRDARPLLYLNGGGRLTVMDPATGAVLRSIDGVGNGSITVPAP